MAAKAADPLAELDSLEPAEANAVKQQLRERVGEVAEQWLAAKTQAKHILNYNGANMAYVHALDTARKLGLSPEERARITTFPSPNYNITIAPPDGERTTTETNNTARERASEAAEKLNQPTASRWQKVAEMVGLPVLGASLLGGGLAIGSYLSDDDPPPPTQPPAATAPVNPADGSVGFTVETFQ